MIAKMSDSDIAVQVDNPLLEKWRTHAKKLKRMHQAAHSLFKGRADMPLFTTVALVLGVGCLNLSYGIGQPSATTGSPAIVSGGLSLLSGSVSALNSGLEWPNKAERHDNYASRFGEVVRDINTECTSRHLQDAEYASEGGFFRHMSTR
jgi:hypothetical protein